jgi:hypothetical protein
MFLKSGSRFKLGGEMNRAAAVELNGLNRMVTAYLLKLTTSFRMYGLATSENFKRAAFFMLFPDKYLKVY